MKVLVYDKKDNHIVAIFEHVTEARFNNREGILTILDEYGQEHHYNRKVVKTRLYQN